MLIFLAVVWRNILGTEAWQHKGILNEEKGD
jgi:hypothetical protein